MTRAVLMASASSLVVNRAVLPSAFGRDPIGDFWRGVMFGWDDRPARAFAGLGPRILGAERRERTFFRWADPVSRSHW